MEKIKSILIICGEASGDLHAANLAQALKELSPGIKISGVGGELLKQTGAEIFCDIQKLAVIGLFDALKKLPKFLGLRRTILKKIKENNPDAIILVDFSGFNLRLAKKINLRLPVIYYVSPQVWASRQGRVNAIRKYVSKMLVLFKFEEEFYKKLQIDATFVGHPLLDIVIPGMAKKDFLNECGLAQDKTTIALLPGSRKTEIEKILPVMLDTAKLLKKELKNLQFVVAKSSQVDWEIYNQKIRRLGLECKVIEGKTYDCLNIADFVLVCSGTATLETALMGKPMVVIYKMGLLNYLLYRPQVKVPFISLVNILRQKRIVPEFIQFQAQADKIAFEVIKLMKNPAEIERMKNELNQIKSSLGEKGAALRSGRIILDFLSKN